MKLGSPRSTLWLAVIAMVFLGHVARAEAWNVVWADNVYNLWDGSSVGTRLMGVKANLKIQNNAPGMFESYVVSMSHEWTGASDNHFFAWQLAELRPTNAQGTSWQFSDGEFHPVLHVRDNNSELQWVYPNSVSLNAWHELKIGRNSSGTWNIYLDNVVVKYDRIWDYQRPFSGTFAEWDSYSFPYNTFLSHHGDIQLKYESDGLWHYQIGTNTDLRTVKGTNDPSRPNPTSVLWTTNPNKLWYDWYAMRLQ